MALNGQSTSNFNLYKPSLTDSPPDITSTNENWDKIDTELKRLGDVGLPANVRNKLPSAVASTESKHIYMSPTGDDAADGTESHPIKNISTAIARFGGTARLFLHFNAGTYAENNAIEVSGCTAVEFLAMDGASVVIRGTYTQHCGYFVAKNIKFESTADALVLNCMSFSVEDCTFTTTNTAVTARFGAVGIVSNCIFTNCGRAIWASSGSYVATNTISGTGNTEGYRTTASIITVGTSTIEATTLASKYGGGVIFRNGNLIGTTANTFVNAT